jgi:hypothetical protein
VDWGLWEGEISLRLGGPDIWGWSASLPLHNGIASGLFSSSVGGRLVASYAGQSAERNVRPLMCGDAADPYMVQGELPDEITVWQPSDGRIHVTEDVVVPAGHVLRIYPDTIILLDPKKSIFVKGAVECLGTVEHPVLFAAANPDAPWGEISHSNTTAKSIYRGTFFIRGGDSPGAGHTTKGPVVRVNHAEIEFDYSNFMDNYGKGLYSTNGNLTFTHCLFSRSEMGMEVVDTNIVVEKSFFVETPLGGDVTDRDALYLNGQGNMSIRDTVFAIGGDDGIDTLSSFPMIENCILRDFEDKGVTVFYGTTRIKNCLILSNVYGISAKGDGTNVYVDRTTIAWNRVSVQSRNKYNDPDAIIKYYVTNSILWNHDRAVQTDYPIEDISITFCDLQGDPLFPGEGNINDDPLFVAPDENNYRLQDASPCRGAGQNGVDMGFDHSAFP